MKPNSFLKNSLSRHPEPSSYRHPEPKAKDLVITRRDPSFAALSQDDGTNTARVILLAGMCGLVAAMAMSCGVKTRLIPPASQPADERPQRQDPGSTEDATPSPQEG